MTIINATKKRRVHQHSAIQTDGSFASDIMMFEMVKGYSFRAVVAGCPENPSLLLVLQQATVDQTTDNTADQRYQPEYPQLLQRPGSLEDCHGGTTCRVN